MKPDGTRTRQEHEQEIVERAAANIALGMSPEAAIKAAGAQWRQELEREAAAKIAHVKRALGIRNMPRKIRR